MPAILGSVLAQAQPPAPGADRGEEFGKTSPIALVVILLLAIATVLLIRSMTKRLRNVPESFDPPDADVRPAGGEDDGGSAAADADSSRGPSSGIDSPSPPGRTGSDG